jgi:pimeloyl-ACP methyl ester carboxylesterase
MMNDLIVSLFLLTVALSFGCAPERTAVSADGVPISFQVKGSGSPALVFIHGWCCDKSYWDAQVAHFSKKHKVVAIDLAGHGDSGLGRKVWTMAAFGEDVVAVADKLGLDRMVLIGHSMGGSVILEAERRMPGRVIGLLGADTFKIIEPEFTREQVDEWVTSFRAEFAQTTANYVRSMFSPTSDSVLVEQIVADMSAAPTEVGLGAMEASLDFVMNDLPGALRDVEAPIRCINSTKYPTDIEAARRYASSFEVAPMSGTGHFVMNEDPETFNRLLEEAVAEFMRLGGSE